MQSTSVTRREVTLIGLYVALEAGFSEGVLFRDYGSCSLPSFVGQGCPTHKLQGATFRYLRSPVSRSPAVK